MASFRDTLQDLVNKDYYTLRDLADKCLKEILPICRIFDEKNDGVVLLHTVVMSAIAADGKLSPKENHLLRDLLGLTAEQVDKMTDIYSPSMVELCDVFADKLSADHKAVLVLFLACVAAVDETITREENAFLRKILEE